MCIIMRTHVQSPLGMPRGSVEMAFELIPLEPLTSDFGETNDGEADEVSSAGWCLDLWIDIAADSTRNGQPTIEIGSLIPSCAHTTS